MAGIVYVGTGDGAWLVTVAWWRPFCLGESDVLSLSLYVCCWCKSQNRLLSHDRTLRVVLYHEIDEW